MAVDITSIPFLVFLNYCLIFVSAEEERVVNVCTNNELNLQCSPIRKCLIELSSAMYGHQGNSNDQCSITGQRFCTSNATDVWEACHLKQECSLLVTQQRPVSTCTWQFVSHFVMVKYTCKCASCTVLPDIANGYVRYREPYLDLGQIATYFCNDGYQLTGSAKRNCSLESEWSGIEPACSIPPGLCPVTGDNVFTYGHYCLEFHGEKVVTWTEAQAKCADKNASLVNSTHTGIHRHIQWHLKHTGYMWLAAETGNKGGCSELSLGEESGKQSVKKVSCDYLSHYMCVYDLTGVSPVEQDGPKNLMPGLAIGLVIAIAIIVLVVLCVVCSIKNKKEDEYDTVEKNNVQGVKIDRNGTNTTPNGDAESIYYDDAISADSASEHNSTPPQAAAYKYAQVQKPKEPDQESTYDEVYVPPNPPPKKSDGQYENVVPGGLNMLGSLKRRFQPRNSKPKPPPVEVEQDSNQSKKPRPAPKPLHLLRKKENDNNSNSFDNSETEEPVVNGEQDIEHPQNGDCSPRTSDLNIIENHLYRSKSGDKKPVTEL